MKNCELMLNVKQWASLKKNKNNAKPDTQFDTVEMGLKWMKTLRN